MSLAFLLFSVVSILSLVLAQTNNATYYGATDIASDPRNQPWNFDQQYRCRLFSHQSRFIFLLFQSLSYAEVQSERS